MIKHFKKISGFWIWAARILPMALLTAIGVCYAFDFITVIDQLLFVALIVFAIFAFAWWWWTMDTVRSLFKMFGTATDRFNDVMAELKELRSDISNNASNRQRNKSKDNQPK